MWILETFYSTLKVVEGRSAEVCVKLVQNFAKPYDLYNRTISENKISR